MGRVVAASDDRVLIERPDRSGNYDGRMTGPTIWDLIESDGRLVGRLVVPEGTTPMAMDDGTLVGVSLDSLDVLRSSGT